MKRALVPLLRSSTTGAPFKVVSVEAGPDSIGLGALVAPGASHWVPIVKGFPLFTEPQPIHHPISNEHLAALESRCFGDMAAYAQALAITPRAVGHDSYAAFRPFNESTRSIYALLPLLRRRLRPGQLILDLWCRTGWTGPMLAAFFPENPVLSLWEGDRGVMGYRAFDHWLGQGKRLPNLDIAFLPPGGTLPVASGAVGLLFGLDTLHRYPWQSLLPEALRVTGPEGMALFPHVHLSNGEPDPYFDRGGYIVHGRDWQAMFEACEGEGGRFVFVLGEAGLFSRPHLEALETAPNTEDYNGVVLVTPMEAEVPALGQKVGAPPAALGDQLIPNPLLRVDPHLGRLTAPDDGLGGHGRGLLDRHPVYEARLGERLPEGLDTLDHLILYWAARSRTLGEIAAHLQEPEAVILSHAQGLIDQEVVVNAPVSAHCAALQRSYAEAHGSVPRAQQTLPALWDQAVGVFGASPYVRVGGDGDVFTFEESDEIVAFIAARLHAAGLKAGDRIAVWSPLHPESIFLFWAASRLGISTAFMDPQWTEAVASPVLEMVAPKVLFVEEGALRGLPESWGGETIVLDPMDGAEPSEEPGDALFLAEWIEDGEVGESPKGEIHPDMEGAILFTSGTTGIPKGVRLSQGALYRSALSLVRLYGWRSEDRLLSTGGLHTMSGLRNPVIGCALVGASMIVAPMDGPAPALEMAESARAHKVSLLSTAPAPLKRLQGLWERLSPRAFAHVRQVLSTAAPLPEALQAWVEDALGAPCRNYYGLTETCGLCLGEPLNREEGPSVGVPVGAIVQVVDDDNDLCPPGQAGNLRIYSENVMMGYLGHAGTKGMVRDGWLYTGDIATMDGHHRVRLMGRRRDIIKGPDGLLRHPVALESWVRTLAFIDEARALGVVDPRGDEGILLGVVPKDGTDEGTLEQALRGSIRGHFGPGWGPAAVYILPSLPSDDELRRLFELS